MGNDWKEFKLGELITVNQSTFSKQDNFKYINYLDTGNITENQIAEIKKITIGADKLPSRAKRKVYPGDIIYSSVRPNQKHYGLLKNTAANLIVSTGFITIRAKKGLAKTGFIYYFLTQPLIINKLQTIAEHSTSAYPSIKPSDIQNLKIRIPKIEVQAAIVKILEFLNSKIELNNQMNQTLESMAQALFKSWFVDFDPVIDNALSSGKKIPKELEKKAEIRKSLKNERKELPEDIKRLFPDEFEFSDELGWIPKGWELSSIGKEFNLTMGQSPPGNTYNENKEGIPFFQGRRDFGFRFPTNRVYCTSPKRFASKNDTLVSVRAPVGDVNMAHCDCCIGRGVSALRHKSESSSYTYYSMLKLREFLNRFESEGTVFGSINKTNFENLPALKFNSELVKNFEKLASPFDKKIELLAKSNIQLTNLRDTLLPKLISGELKIPEAEKIIKDHESKEEAFYAN
jgi:type I restriction enzyme S subunit